MLSIFLCTCEKTLLNTGNGTQVQVRYIYGHIQGGRHQPDVLVKEALKEDQHLREYLGQVTHRPEVFRGEADLRPLHAFHVSANGNGHLAIAHDPEVTTFTFRRHQQRKTPKMK